MFSGTTVLAAHVHSDQGPAGFVSHPPGRRSDTQHHKCYISGEGCLGERPSPFITIPCICQSQPARPGKGEAGSKLTREKQQGSRTKSKFSITYLVLLLNKKNRKSEMKIRERKGHKS